MIKHKPIHVNNLSSVEQEFYATLGVLSVSFASMESKVKQLLALLINPDEELVSMMMIQNLNLENTLSRLSDINNHREFYETELTEIIKRVRKIKKERNLFIHGVWYTPYLNEGSIKVHCDERKVVFQKESYRINSDTKHWSMNNVKEYDLTFLKDIVIEVDSIIHVIEDIISIIIEDTSCIGRW